MVSWNNVSRQLHINLLSGREPNTNRSNWEISTNFGVMCHVYYEHTIVDSNIHFWTITDHTFGVCPRTLPARASEPCTLPKGENNQRYDTLCLYQVSLEVLNTEWVGCPGISHPKFTFLGHLKLCRLCAIICFVMFPPQWHQVPHLVIYLKNNDSDLYMECQP